MHANDYLKGVWMMFADPNQKVIDATKSPVICRRSWLISFISLALFSAQVYADKTLDYDSIGHLYPRGDRYEFKLNTVADPSVSTCNGGRTFQIQSSHANYDAMVSTLLTAYTMGHRVRVYYDDAQSPKCAAIISRMVVKK